MLFKSLCLVISLVVNVLQNAFACYMKLGHYKEAKACALYIRQVLPDYLKAYLLEAQCVYYNKCALLPDVRAALRTASEGVAVSGLAVANSQAFLKTLQQLEKMKELLQLKLNDIIASEARLLDAVLDRSRKLAVFSKQHPGSLAAAGFPRVYDDFRVVRK